MDDPKIAMPGQAMELGIADSVPSSLRAIAKQLEQDKAKSSFAIVVTHVADQNMLFWAGRGRPAGGDDMAELCMKQLMNSIDAIANAHPAVAAKVFAEIAVADELNRVLRGEGKAG